MLEITVYTPNRFLLSVPTLVDEEGRVVTADTETSEGGGVKAKATKQQKVADKTRGKTGRRKKAITKEGATVSEETATQVCWYTLNL